MMKKRVLSLTGVFAGAALCLVLTSGCASTWNPLVRWNSKNRVDTLMITGNYAESRVLADLGHLKSRQPILLICSGQDGTETICWVSHGRDAKIIQTERFEEYVKFLTARRIVVIGDERYVPRKYVEMIRDDFPVLVLDSTDWDKNAHALGDLLKYRRLPKDYGKCMSRVVAAYAGHPVPSDRTAGSAPVLPATPPPAAAE
ncbi:MAG: hypothetical protein KAI66_01125 [Lentisphaeria bacterium]|nr:hypothetical protein [Lentisphaeria bacterium]